MIFTLIMDQYLSTFLGFMHPPPPAVHQPSHLFFFLSLLQDGAVRAPRYTSTTAHGSTSLGTTYAGS